MGAGFFLIAIMGCADGSAACTPVATMPTRYDSQAACSAATTQALPAQLGYADHAISSYASFKELKGAGVIPRRARFQVSLPTPLAPIAAFVALPILFERLSYVAR